MYVATHHDDFKTARWPLCGALARTCKTIVGEGADRLETLYMRGDIERNERITGAGGIGLQPLKE